MSLQTADYHYHLPADLIAQRPSKRRDGSRMLVLSRRTGRRELTTFDRFPDFLHAGDCLVLNDTRVIPARLLGAKAVGGGRVEALLLEEREPGRWQALLRPGRRLRSGTRVVIDAAADAAFEVVARHDDGTADIRFDAADVLQLADRAGRTPLPPYIRRAPDSDDRQRYQTVYAEAPGAVAAPTAGLHFTAAVLAAVRARGIETARVTLHVGIGTFRPVETAKITDHDMHKERFRLPTAAAACINRSRARGGRVVAVGTTVVRVLETCAAADGTVIPRAGRTDLFMHPPYRPRVVDALLTNFHLPRSSLLMLASTFVTRRRLLDAYSAAVAARFRFYSYGDCMLLL